jgi:hypothetical protein
MDKSASYVYMEKSKAEIEAEAVSRRVKFERELQELRAKMTPKQLEQYDRITEALLSGVISVINKRQIKSEK